MVSQSDPLPVSETVKIQSPSSHKRLGVLVPGDVEGPPDGKLRSWAGQSGERTRLAGCV